MKKLVCLFMAITMMVLISVNSYASASIISDGTSGIGILEFNSALAQKEDNAIQMYDILLNEWSTNGSMNDSDIDYPEFYGGAFLDADKNLVIQVTDLNEEVQKYFAELIDTDNIVFQEVKYAYSELLEQMEAISQNMTTNGALCDISGAGIVSSNNGINIYFDPNVTRVKYVRGNYDEILWIDNISFIEVKSTEACSSPEVGSKINVDGTNYNSYRSIGFWAKDSAGNYGIVTAPHSTMTVGMSARIGSTSFGEVSSISFGGSVDCAFIRRTSTSFTPTRNVSSLNLSISGYVRSVLEGATIYTIGDETGLQSGTVLNSNHTANYSNTVLTNTFLTSNMVNNGDSGGVVLQYLNSKIYIAGIIVAKSRPVNSNESDPGKCVACKYTEIVDALGVNMY